MKSLICLILSFIIFSQLAVAQQEASPISKAKQPDYNLLQKQLEEIYDLDQNIRKVNFDSINANPAKANAFFLKMQEVDSLNQRRVLPILEQYGWLPKSKIGEKASDAIYFVVQHSNLETIEKYLPQMEKLAQQGEASTTDAAAMRDRLLMFQGKKQLYGTQASNWVREDGAMIIWPIEKVKKVNQRRKKLGFTTSVEENAKDLGAIYNPQEELPKKKNSFQN